MYWKYILDVGVVCEEAGIKLYFGAAREDLLRVSSLIRNKTKGDLRAALRALKKKGYDFKKGDYSYTDVEHKIDLGESGANGAEHKNQVCWIMIAKR